MCGDTLFGAVELVGHIHLLRGIEICREQAANPEQDNEQYFAFDRHYLNLSFN